MLLVSHRDSDVERSKSNDSRSHGITFQVAPAPQKSRAQSCRIGRWRTSIFLRDYRRSRGAGPDP